MTEEKLFEKYMEKEEGGGISRFFKNPKAWVIITSVIAAVILFVIFYDTVIVGGMSSEEVRNSVEIVWHDSKWVDKKVTPQEVTVVPSISIKVKNIGRRPLHYVDFLAVFAYEESGTVFGDGMARVFKEPLQPGGVSEVIFIKSNFGYSASSREAFLANKGMWKKATVKIAARSKGSGVVNISDTYPVKQEIEGMTGEGEEKPADYQDEDTRKLAHSIRVENPDSIWVNKVVTRKEVVIVPSITFQVKNVGAEPLKNVYFKGIFKYTDTGEILSEGLIPALNKELAPGETGAPIKVQAEFGFAAATHQGFYLENRRWQQVKVELYAKSKTSQYALLGIYPIKAKIQGVKVN